MTEEPSNFSKDSSPSARSGLSSPARSASLTDLRRKRRDLQKKRRDEYRRARKKLEKPLASPGESGKVPLKRRRPERKIMPFVPQMTESVIAGSSIFTFRYNPYPFYPKVGEKFRAHSERAPLPGVYVCRRKLRCTLRKMKTGYWRGEGVSSPEAYDELMRLIMKTQKLDLDRPGYLYVFERLE